MGRGGVNPSLEALVRGHVSAAKKENTHMSSLSLFRTHVSFTRVSFFSTLLRYFTSPPRQPIPPICRTPLSPISQNSILFFRAGLCGGFSSLCVSERLWLIFAGDKSTAVFDHGAPEFYATTTSFASLCGDMVEQKVLSLVSDPNHVGALDAEASY